MQCGYDSKGNSVPTILLLMQERLYSQGGLKVSLPNPASMSLLGTQMSVIKNKDFLIWVWIALQAEGIFRINPENSQEEHVREQLNKGTVPEDIDVHCLASLIKVRSTVWPT